MSKFNINDYKDKIQKQLKNKIEAGEEVTDYELPDDDLLETMSIRPGAAYAYDKFGRKYKILDVNDSVEDDIISDDEYDEDDKYAFAAECELEDEE